MSRHIKSDMERVKDYISCLEEECDALHYEVYVCHRERRLIGYELTLREVDEQYCELKRLEKKYNIELRKERYKSAKEEIKRTYETLASQVQRLVHLENEKKVKGNEIVMEIEEHVEKAATEDPIEEVKQVTEDPIIEEVKQVEDTVVTSEEQVEETMRRLDCFRNVEDRKVVDDIIEVEYIDFIIPEYLHKPRSLTSEFSKFFASKSFFFKWKHIFFFPAQSCLVLDFYKTRGRVFSNKGRMMRNKSGKDLYMLLNSLYVFQLRKN